MADITPILTFPELMRLILSGGEYRKKRGPELLANWLEDHQDENALAAVLSDWFRENFVDENHTAALFALAAYLRARGPRFIALAKVIEMIPDISEEVKRRPAITAASTPEERQKLLRENMATAVSEKYAAVKATLTSSSNTGDTMPETTDSKQAWLNKILGGLGGLRKSLGETLQDLGTDLFTAARYFFQFNALWLGVSVLYLILTLFVTFGPTEAMPWYARASFLFIVGVPAMCMIVGAFMGRRGAALQAAAFYLLWFFGSTLLVITFTLTAVSTIHTKVPSYDILCVGQIVVVVWDRVVMGITQKGLGLPGFFAKFIHAASDGKISEEEVKDFAAHWKDNTFLVAISVTVAGAINVAWLFIMIVTIVENLVFLPIGVGIIGLQLLLGSAYIRMALKQGREGEYSKHLGLEKYIQTWSHRLYNGSVMTSVLAPLLALVLILGYFFFSEPVASQLWTAFRNTSRNAVSETVTSVGSRPERVAQAQAEPAQEPVRQREDGTGGGEMMDCGGKLISKAKVEKRKRSLGGTPLPGTESGYPWHCREDGR